VAAAAAARPGLERQIETRRAAERTAAAAEAKAAATERRLREVAAAVGLDSSSGTDDLVAGLQAWQRDRSERMRHRETAITEWQRLQSLLDGSSLEDLAERAAADARRARELADQVGEPVAGPAEAPTVLEARVARLNEALIAETSRHDALRGSLQARREALPDVAEAEESVLTAKGELRRVEALSETLDRTLSLLRSAEERVHRSLSPVLAASIGRWLPLVCRGAYVDVSVDPADLSISVKEAATGKWREARLLSEGTREQIYLLLRAAMAEHLVVNGETAPLLLDEVTVQSDPDRKLQLLDVLHRLSTERQVVLFTHDQDVLAWADRRLDTERDAIVLLPGRAAGSAHAAATAGDLAAVPIGD
jgi:DNA repair exonuclease SbcCD ATPase subunit